jgi:hypothetical protein
VLVWDVDRDREVARLAQYASDPSRIGFAVSGDGKTIAAGGDDGSIVILGLPCGAPCQDMPRAQPGVQCAGLEFSPDGSTLASDGRFTDTTRPIAYLQAQLAIAVRNPRVREVTEVMLIDVATGRRLQRAEWEDAPVFSPEGSALATTDGTSINVRAIPGRR